MPTIQNDETVRKDRSGVRGNARTVRKNRSTRRVKRKTKKVPATAVYLSYEEQESLKMRRRLKQKLKTTKSTIRGQCHINAKKIRNHKKILADRKGTMAKQRAKQDIENDNRHLLKKILQLHYRKGDSSTGTDQDTASRAKATFNRHVDNKTSYMRQRYNTLSQISRENKRMIGKLLSTTARVDRELDPVTSSKLGGSMRPGHMGIMRELSGMGDGFSDDGSVGGGTMRQRPQSAPMHAQRPSSVPRGREGPEDMFEERQAMREAKQRAGQQNSMRRKQQRPRSAVHLSRQTPPHRANRRYGEEGIPESNEDDVGEVLGDRDDLDEQGGGGGGGMVDARYE